MGRNVLVCSFILKSVFCSIFFLSFIFGDKKGEEDAKAEGRHVQ